jgi:glyoxylase-like metal-dependent hydrolase (beta-lactamase superfamily II)
VERLGFAAADVRRVLATHLDGDHAGGLADFPEAEVHVTATELAAASNPRLRERSRYIATQWRHGPRWVEHQTGAGGERWFGFESVRILPGLEPEVLLIPLAGHSFGHSGIAVKDGERWLLHCGDAYLSREEVATPSSCPPLMAAFQRLSAADNAARVANTERLRELAHDHGDEVALFSAHDPQELARLRTPVPAATA